MASLREFRKKIKSIKSTQQITKAMKMVSAAKLRRAQSAILSARPFALKMRDLLGDLAGRVLSEENETSEKNSAPLHPLLLTYPSNKMVVLLVTADKGLCGSFNANLIRKTSEFLKSQSEKEILFFVVGKKGRDFFKRMSYPVVKEYVGLFQKISYTHAEIIGRDLIQAYLDHKPSEVVVIYNEFKSLIQQRLMIERLLPVQRPVLAAPSQKMDYFYEPRKEMLLDALLPRTIKSQVYRILLESYAAELGARMAAMDSATKNASELIDVLTLKLNRTRQAIITREIAELVGGAEALK